MSLDYLGYELKELKATDNSGGGVFSGYASTWDKDLYDDVDAYPPTSRTAVRASPSTGNTRTARPTM